MNKESKWEECISGNNQQFLPQCASLITKIPDVHLSFLKKMHSYFAQGKQPQNSSQFLHPYQSPGSLRDSFLHNLHMLPLLIRKL